MMTTSLSHRAMIAMQWNYGGFLFRTLAGIGVSVVLARLLGPEPFGLIGVAALLFGLGNQIADGGFSSALIQARDLDQRRIRSVFTAQVLIGLSMTVAAYISAPLIAGIFHHAGVADVIRQTAPLFVTQSFGHTATGLLKRRMAFKPVQSAQIASYIGYAGCATVLALAGYGVQSLIAAQLVQALVYSVCVYAVVRHSVRPCFDASGAGLLWFGSKITSANILNWMISNVDNFVVGRTFGPVSLGLYSRAFNLASNPSEGFVGAVQQVLFAACSRVDQNHERMRRAYVTCVSGVSLVCFPVFLTCSAASYPIITALYGNRWADAAPLFCAFTLAMPLFCLMALAGPVLSASDRMNQDIRAQAVSLGVCAVLVMLASLISVRAVAYSLPIAYAFRFWRVTQPVLLLLRLRWSDVWDVVAGPAWAGLFTAGCVYVTANLIAAVGGVTGGLLLGVLSLVGASAFFVILVTAAGAIVPWPIWRLVGNSSEFIPAPVASLLARFGGDKMRVADQLDCRSTGVQAERAS